jgi:hypothetical protein
MLSIGALDKVPVRRVWVRKTLCAVCKRPIVMTLRDDCKSVDRECYCDRSCRPVEAVTNNPDGFYEIKLEEG